MKTNPEEIPFEVLEWMPFKAFENLDSEDQATVLKYMDRQTYNELHVAMMHLDQAFIENKQHKLDIFQSLEMKFDQKYSNTKPQRIFPVWQYAAAASLAACLILTIVLFQHKTPVIHANQTVFHDTVFLDNNTDTVKIYDTVYYESAATYGSSRINHQPSHHKNKTPDQSFHTSEEWIDFSINSFTELDKEQNKQRSKSIKDDSLIHHYGFVTL